MSYYETVFPTMPWGKHKGAMVDRLPESYLRWMAKSMSDPFLRVCAQAVIDGKKLDRVALIDALGDEFDGALIELKTVDLEKLYIRYMVERTATMRVMIAQEVM